ncbi:hypothetical protein FL857_06815 [Criibacterium bergeronii]|uniref:Uncharacterized protein n=2 Tax=Criibacterium bergeronii TaxID=1871336 RepID=A0A552V4V8_9FIRM|nr:hypothetical protein FL857_06815 [Criibacterium bergeronii]
MEVIMNRIAIIVVVGDKDFLDEYIIYLIRGVGKFTSKTIVTVNGTLPQDALRMIKEVADTVIVRKNLGYDCGAYKDSIEKYIGWDEIYKYDELLLINDSCFGPIYDLSELFDKMNTLNLDFWGITQQPPIKRYKFSSKTLPYHVQSYFMNINSKMLHSPDFKEYWRKVIPADDYYNAVANFELTFTKFFNERGYKSGAYIDSIELCPTEDENLAYIFMNSYRLISEFMCPFLKKKVFSYRQDVILSANSGETAKKTLDYIENHTSYDVNLIWKCLIKNNSLEKIKENLHLDSFITDDSAGYGSAYIIIFLRNQSLQEPLISLIEQLKSKRNFILVGNTDVVDLYQCRIGNEAEYLFYENAESITALIDKLNHSDVVCLTDDNSVSSSEVWNISKRNIFDVFSENKHIGFFNIPRNYNDTNFFEHFEDSCNINQLIIRSKLFTKALEDGKFLNILYDWYCFKMTDKYGLGNRYKKIAKRNVYCYGDVSIIEQAEKIIGDYHFMLKEYIGKYIIPIGIQEIKNVRKVNQYLIDFCTGKKRIFIYGSGEIGRECSRYLISHGIVANGFIVSDGMREEHRLFNLTINELSEIDFDKKDGVVIATDSVFYNEIIKNLNTKKVDNFMTYEVV